MKTRVILSLLVFVLVFVSLPSSSISSEANGANDYRIGVGDKLSISVWNSPDLSVTVSVRPDGKISFFLIDDILVQGLTPLEVKALLTQKLKPSVSDPDVTVIVIEINSIDFYVVGEVVRPGRYSQNKEISLLHLLALAGGVKPTADLESAFVLRGHDRLSINLYKLLHQNDMTQNIMLQGYDLFYVPDNQDKGITVLGEINRPGVIPYREGLRLSDAITLSEGINKYAKASEIKVIRDNKKITVDFDKILETGDMKRNIEMEPRDVVIVPKSLF